MWWDKQPHGYSKPILFQVTAGRSYADLISGYSRPIIFQSYFGLQQADHMPILFQVTAADHVPILFRVTAGRSYFRTWRKTCMTAGKTTMAVGKMNYGCFEMLSWPHRTSNNIVNICFWFLETCTKCSYFIEKNMRPGAQHLAFEVKFDYIAHRSTNIPWTSGLRLGKFPDNWRLMC